jgi:hypothetical protein
MSQNPYGPGQGADPNEPQQPAQPPADQPGAYQPPAQPAPGAYPPPQQPSGQPRYPAPGAYPPPAPQYPAAAYGAPAGTSKNNIGTWALVLGILSIVCFGLLAGIPAIILGNKGKAAAAQGLATNRGAAQAGFILGIIGTVFSLIGIVYQISR